MNQGASTDVVTDLEENPGKSYFKEGPHENE